MMQEKECTAEEVERYLNFMNKADGFFRPYRDSIRYYDKFLLRNPAIVPCAYCKTTTFNVSKCPNCGAPK